MSNLIEQTVLVNLELRGTLSFDGVKALTIAHGFEEEEVLDAIAAVVAKRCVSVTGDSLTFVKYPQAVELTKENLEAADKFREARNKYLREKNKNLFTKWWDKLCGGLCLLVVIIGTTVGLCAGEGQWVNAQVTAYCPCVICCGSFADGFTANMTRVNRVPYNFASDKSLPFGTRIYVPTGFNVLDNIRADDRVFFVDDRGGKLDTEARNYGVLRLDLRVRHHDWAMDFGRKTIPVYVETP